MDNMSKVETIKQAVELLLSACPETQDLKLTVLRYKSDGTSTIEVKTYSPNTYQEATDWVRSFGCQVRRKEIQCGEQTKVSGVVDGVTFAAVGSGLPPTCRKEDYVEKVPKVETKETGDFIEVKRTRVVCGNGSVAEDAVVVEES